MSKLEPNAANEFESQIDKLVDNQIDKLVDGELNDNQLRELLLALEAQPDGWRRCALAFVEAQTLRRDLAGISSAAASEDEAVYEFVPVQQRNSRKDRIPVVAWAAMAASLLLAFALGNSVRLWNNENTELAANRPEVMVAATDNGQSEPNTEADPEQPADAAPASKETLMVSLPASEGEDEQTVEIPLMEKNAEQMESLLALQSPVLSDAETRTLESTGHEVEQQRVFYPVNLDDGRQAVVPMDIVKIRYTGGWQ